MITASGDQNGAELAIRNGAWDYIQKPASVHDMTLPIIRAIQYREERKGKQQGAAAPRLLKLDGIVGNCPKMKERFELVAQAADT
jgi:two-component system NtrC family response regulator